MAARTKPRSGTVDILSAGLGLGSLLDPVMSPGFAWSVGKTAQAPWNRAFLATDVVLCQGGCASVCWILEDRAGISASLSLRHGFVYEREILEAMPRGISRARAFQWIGFEQPKLTPKALVPEMTALWHSICRVLLAEVHCMISSRDGVQPNAVLSLANRLLRGCYAWQVSLSYVGPRGETCFLLLNLDWL